MGYIFGAGLFIGFCLGVIYGEHEAKSKKPCEFCRSESRILAYQKGNKDEKRIAKYCPLCGRELPFERKEDAS